MNPKSTSSLLSELIGTTSIKSFIATQEENFVNNTFCDYLQGLSTSRNLSLAGLFLEAKIDKSYGYKIMKGEKNPSRNKILQLALAMNLTLYETQTLLRLGQSNGLHCKDKRDAIIIFALNKSLSITQTDDLLYENGENTILSAN